MSSPKRDDDLAERLGLPEGMGSGGHDRCDRVTLILVGALGNAVQPEAREGCVDHAERRRPFRRPATGSMTRSGTPRSPRHRPRRGCRRVPGPGRSSRSTRWNGLRPRLASTESRRPSGQEIAHRPSSSRRPGRSSEGCRLRPGLEMCFPRSRRPLHSADARRGKARSCRRRRRGRTPCVYHRRRHPPRSPSRLSIMRRGNGIPAAPYERDRWQVCDV